MYFANDPYPNSSYSLLFLVRLLYRDMSIEIGRAKPNAVLPVQHPAYDFAFSFQNGKLTPISPEQMEYPK
jgi:hypothetical protein